MVVVVVVVVGIGGRGIAPSLSSLNTKYNHLDNIYCAVCLLLISQKFRRNIISACPVMQ